MNRDVDSERDRATQVEEEEGERERRCCDSCCDRCCVLVGLVCLVTGLFCLMIGLFWRRRRERENDDAAIDAVTDAVTDASAPDDIQIPISSYIQLKNKIKKIHQQDEHNPSLCEKIRLCKKIPLVTIESRSSPKSRPSHGRHLLAD